MMKALSLALAAQVFFCRNAHADDQVFDDKDIDSKYHSILSELDKAGDKTAAEYKSALANFGSLFNNEVRTVLETPSAYQSFWLHNSDVFNSVFGPFTTDWYSSIVVPVTLDQGTTGSVTGQPLATPAVGHSSSASVTFVIASSGSSQSGNGNGGNGNGNGDDNNSSSGSSTTGGSESNSGDSSGSATVTETVSSSESSDGGDQTTSSSDQDGNGNGTESSSSVNFAATKAAYVPIVALPLLALFV